MYLPGLVLGNFQYFTGYDKHMLGRKSVIGQTYHLLVCLIGSQKQNNKAQRENV